jgi:hypothetical protein
MKFLKASRPLSAEDEFAVARLNALAHRVRISCTDEGIGAPSGDMDASDPLEIRDVLQ